jgi:AcrR family transcriptional regulator
LFVKAPRTKPTAPSRARSPARRRKPSTPKTDEVSPRIARRERRRERSREEIVDAARRVLLARGIAATTLDAVAEEVGLTKAALYYYYPSKDALLFEIVFGVIQAQSHAVHDAVAEAKDGGEALRAIIRETVRVFGSRMDDFRLTFMHGQVAGPGAVHIAAQQLERIRPFNDLTYAGAAKRIAEDAKRTRGRARVEPRLMAFLANVAAIGLLTMKGMVETAGDPLIYSDDELIEGLARIFEAAARP